MILPRNCRAKVEKQGSYSYNDGVVACKSFQITAAMATAAAGTDLNVAQVRKGDIIVGASATVNTIDASATFDCGLTAAAMDGSTADVDFLIAALALDTAAVEQENVKRHTVYDDGYITFGTSAGADTGVIDVNIYYLPGHNA
jgi:hypothetical protein